MKELDAVAKSEMLDLCSSAERSGFRLNRFEIYNWGTFHNQVWGLDFGGENALLTGDIGSGKSTFVDAITTLLVPPQKIIYNKAAGADNRERNLRSYVFGHYKSERGESSVSVRPVALRDHRCYSVILGRFYNQDLDRTVTLTQIFWIKDVQEQPARLYVVADRPLAIAEHLAGFGSEVKDLRKRLRAMPDVELFDTFPPFGAAYRRRFGIESEQALDLFNQTVSMKSVGNLTDFVREHMLESFPVESRIAALVAHFDDLNRAHEAVLKAKNQIELLTPLVDNCNTLEQLAGEVTLLRTSRSMLRPWSAFLKLTLLSERTAKLEAELSVVAGRIESFSEKQRARRLERDEVKTAIAENGGNRLERIKAEIFESQREKEQRARRAGDYDALARTAGLSGVVSEEIFLANQRDIAAEKGTTEGRQAEKQNELTEAIVELRQLEEQEQELRSELQSLRQRRSNLPRNMLDLREQLCRATGLTEETLPFAGELLQVRPEERDWEGAMERVLHNFGLSLLVPDAHYAALAQSVDRTHLGGRIVYYRIRGHQSEHFPMQPAIDAASLVHKIGIKPHPVFYDWLDAEIRRRFNYVCCDSLDMFRRERQAITRSGQIKGVGERHEKDDRYRIDDRSRLVLGWSNEAKIAALETQARQLDARLQKSSARIATLQAESKALQERLLVLHRLSVFQSFRDLDWKSPMIEIERLEAERRELEQGSDILRTLQNQLAGLEQLLEESERKLAHYNQQNTLAGHKLDNAQSQSLECQEILAAIPEEVTAKEFPRLDEMARGALGEQNVTVESCDNREREMREWIQTRIDAEDKKIARLSEQIVKAMESYRARYPLDTQEADASIQAAEEYRGMLNQLASDDLPRFEARFKELLNENTIREVANFQSQLYREREAIRGRIELINKSLQQIDYNPGRYITLEAEPNTDVEIRDFHQDLRACTEGTLTGSYDEEYSESKFLHVKTIIERFRGREGSAQLDKRWKEKVTDVREWFTFSASERWREDDREFEHYTDSGGKSGGQKEKLAYTVLAASLAYQFGLEWNKERLRSFRFVVIDEAFGRGSDESARYGLDLFKRLNLQLLIVTPLQKIHIIEPFVASVGFVHNHEGRQSMLRNLTIEEYRAERDARSA